MSSAIYDRHIHIEEANKNNRGSIKVRVEQMIEGFPTWLGTRKRSSQEATKRGKVYGFSEKSRKRLMDKFQRCDYEALTDRGRLVVKFLTLTFGQFYPDSKEAKKLLRTFWKRIHRKYPLACGVWRLELQKRGAPHFHLILFNFPFTNKDTIANMWHKVIGDCYADNSKNKVRAPFTRIEAIRSANGVASYVAKYVSKTDGTKSEGSEPQSALGFNSLPYLTAEAMKANFDLVSDLIKRAESEGFKYDGSHNMSSFLAWFDEVILRFATDAEKENLCPPMGRVWGIFNSKKLIEYPVNKKSIMYSQYILRGVKKYFMKIRSDVDFHYDFDDGGCSFYVNGDHEVKGFYKVLNHLIKNCPEHRIKEEEAMKKSNSIKDSWSWASNNFSDEGTK